MAVRQVVTPEEIKQARTEYEHFLRWFHGEDQKCRTGSFTRTLFELLGHADYVNLRTIADAFPAETYVYLEHTGQLDRVPFLQFINEYGRAYIDPDA